VPGHTSPVDVGSLLTEHKRRIETLEKLIDALGKRLAPASAVEYWYGTDQSVSTVGTGASYNFTFTEQSSSGGLAAASGDQVIVRKPGFYLLVATANWSVNATGYRQLGIYTPVGYEAPQNSVDNRPAVDGNFTSHYVVAPNALTGGTPLEVTAFQNSGGDRSINEPPGLLIVRLGAGTRPL
jgi:hypothetical protein